MRNLLFVLTVCLPFCLFAQTPQQTHKEKQDTIKQSSEEQIQDVETAFQKGQRYFYQRKIEMAEVMLLISLKEDPENAAAYSYLGDLFLEKKRYDESLNAYLKAIELNPEDAENHFRIGQVYYYQKNAANAIAHFETSYKLNDSMTFALYHIGLTCLMLNRDKEGAITNWEKYISLMPNDAQKSSIEKVIELLKNPEFIIPPESSGVSVEEALNRGITKDNGAAKADKYHGIYENEEL